jgi:hypothetical protein
MVDDQCEPTPHGDSLDECESARKCHGCFLSAAAINQL